MRWRGLNFRAKRVKKSWFKKTCLLLGLVLLTFGLYKLLTTFFLIKTIKISARQGITLKGVEKLAGQNLLFLNKNKWEREIEKENPVLKEVRIERKFPSQILIAFKEREAKASIFNPTSNIAFLIDEKGVILEQQKKEEGVPVIIASLQNFKIGDRIRDENIGFVINLISVLEASAQSSQFEIDDNSRVLRGTLKDNILLLVGLDKDKDQILYSLQLLLKKFKIEGNWPKKIDLRFEKPVLSF